MNVVVFTEGKGDSHVYKSWIPFVNANLSLVNNVSDITSNNYYVRYGYGYPSYFEDIKATIQEVNAHGHIDRLVIGIDTEDMTLAQKQREMEDFLSSETCIACITVVYQHFCIETWALANKNIYPSKTTQGKFQTFMKYFDVSTSDPEDLPDYPPLDYNRAQFAFAYLKAALQSSNPRASYIKARPRPLLNQGYFHQVHLRRTNTGHVPSFSFFLNAFV